MVLVEGCEVGWVGLEKGMGIWGWLLGLDLGLGGLMVGV